MGPDTDTKPEGAGPSRVQQWKTIGFKVMIANALALLVLGLGVTMFSEYKRSLVFAELALLEDESLLWARAIAEMVPDSGPAGARGSLEKGVRSLGEVARRHVYLFSPDGRLILHQDPPPAKQDERDSRSSEKGSPFRIVARALLWLFPLEYDLPRYSDSREGRIEHYPDAQLAAAGNPSVNAWTGESGELMFSAAVPIVRSGQLIGTLLLVKDATETEEAFENARSDAVRVFLAALAITLTFSLYVSAVVVRPLNRLARAADRVRRVRNRTREIPDMSARGDEIGLLSQILREMTEALWLRMDSIEQFAADVAHELKNPLTSLRSALETLPRIKDEEKRARLLAVMEEDTRRIDRLISDIARASRLDAELSRDQLETVDLRGMLRDLAATNAQLEDRMERVLPDRVRTRVRGITLIMNLPENAGFVLGNVSRLQQVMDNLISNAISFSPNDGTVTVTATPAGESAQARIVVEDEGPGIPEGKLSTIFDRFYSERPFGEAFGTHSGLGLSIARQIVEAFGGKISAENRLDSNGKIAGARFIVTLMAAGQNK